MNSEVWKVLISLFVCSAFLIPFVGKTEIVKRTYAIQTFNEFLTLVNKNLKILGVLLCTIFQKENRHG
jgi:hypothetical protein